MKFKLSINIILLIALFGCRSTPKTPDNQPTKAQSPTAISTSLITDESSKTPTMPTKGENSSDNWDASKRCVTIYSTRPNDYELTGVLALRSLSSTTLGLNLSLLNLENNKTINFSTPNPVDFAYVSSSRKTLGYLWYNNATSKWEVRLVNSEGEQQKVAWSSKEDFGFEGMLNDQRVVIRDGTSYIVVDPFLNSQEKFSSLDFPDFDTNNVRNYFVAFEANLNRAIYKHFDIIILDLRTNTVLTQIEDAYDRSPIFDWLPANGQLAIVASNTSVARLSGSPIPDEIFIIEQKGQVRQLTHLYESFIRHIEINGLSWSPNGEKIAFWLDNGQDVTLMVADTLTGNVVNYCVSSDLFLFPTYLPAPIWSPDGKQLLVENRHAEHKSSLLIVDITKNIAFPIAENENPVGWMTTP